MEASLGPNLITPHVAESRMAGAAPPAVYDDLILHISPDKVWTEEFHGLTLWSSVLP
jgi:hypothetical protein